MKKRNITILVLAVLVVIIGVIVVDFLGSRPDRRGNNPYALDVDSLRNVDEALISHRETRNYTLGSLKASGICLYGDMLYIVGDSSLLVLSTEGTTQRVNRILPDPTCIAADDHNLYIGHGTFMARYDHSGKLIARWPDMGDRTVITSVAVKGNRIYVADAGNRRVVICDPDGEILGAFEGKADSEAGHGFIIPSPYFDVVVNSYGELWAVNPGKKAIENYTDNGEMRGFWQKNSTDINGFAGCCNPAEIAVLGDGAFVTSEKGMVRIKIHEPSGELRSVVAPPALFKEEGKAPEVCADDRGNIYALDFDRNTVRIFKPEKDG
jgi:DNA-binding beta-propeller fold protein YncE